MKATKKIFGDNIGKTKLSYFLDINYRKNKLDAETLESFYDEIEHLMAIAFNEGYKGAIEDAKKQGLENIED